MWRIIFPARAKGRLKSQVNPSPGDESNEEHCKHEDRERGEANDKEGEDKAVKVKKTHEETQLDDIRTMPFDLGVVCTLSCHPRWRSEFPMWRALMFLSLGLMALQMSLAISLWQDEEDLDANLFVRSAGNKKFTGVRSVCMILVTTMMFSSVLGFLKKATLLVLVFDTVQDTFTWCAALCALSIEFISIALTVMVSFVIIMSSPDEDGAINIVMNFTALLIVAEIDDVVAPFVFDFLGVFGGKQGLGSLGMEFIESYELSPTECKRNKATKSTRQFLTMLSLLFCLFLCGFGFFGLLSHVNYCNASESRLLELGDVYLTEFFPLICSNSTNYCVLNQQYEWVDFYDTECGLEFVEAAAEYFVRIANDTSTI